MAMKKVQQKPKKPVVVELEPISEKDEDNKESDDECPKKSSMLEESQPAKLEAVDSSR